MTQTNSKGSAVHDLMLTLVNKTFYCRIHRKRIPKFERIKTERSNLCLRIECMYMCIYIYIFYVYKYIYTYVCMYLNIYIYISWISSLLIWRFWLLASRRRSALPQARTRNCAWQMGLTSQQNEPTGWSLAKRTVGETWYFLEVFSKVFFFWNFFFCKKKQKHHHVFFQNLNFLVTKTTYRKKSVRWSQDEMVKGKTRLVYLLKKNCLYWYHRYLYLCLSRLRLMPGWDFQIHEAS